jgi:hypothetical protein
MISYQLKKSSACKNIFLRVITFFAAGCQKVYWGLLCGGASAVFYFLGLSC